MSTGSPSPQAVAPVAAGDVSLWPVGALAVLLIALLPGGSLAAAASAVWGGLALLGWLAGAPGAESLVWRVGPPLVMYTIVVALAIAGRLDLAGAALAPLAALLLAALLPRPDTASAAQDWGVRLAAVLWALAGALGLTALLTIPAELGAAAVVVVALLLAFNVGRRAGRLQGQREPVAIGIGAVVAVLGSIMLAGGGGAPGLVVGLIGGLAGVAYAPAPPPAAAPLWRSLVAVHHQLVFVAPLTFAVLWLGRTLL